MYETQDQLLKLHRCIVINHQEQVVVLHLVAGPIQIDLHIPETVPILRIDHLRFLLQVEATVIPVEVQEVQASPLEEPGLLARAILVQVHPDQDLQVAHPDLADNNCSG